jgi:hypothetical protein
LTKNIKKLSELFADTDNLTDYGVYVQTPFGSIFRVHREILHLITLVQREGELSFDIYEKLFERAKTGKKNYLIKLNLAKNRYVLSQPDIYLALKFIKQIDNQVFMGDYRAAKHKIVKGLPHAEIIKTVPVPDWKTEQWHAKIDLATDN